MHLLCFQMCPTSPPSGCCLFHPVGRVPFTRISAEVQEAATGPLSDHQNYPNFLFYVVCGVEANGDVNYKLLVIIIS